MGLEYPYALGVGAIGSVLVLFGYLWRRPSPILIGVVLSSLTASPIYTFTRGAAGAIFSSDVVAAVLLVLYLTDRHRRRLLLPRPKFLKTFRLFIILALVSTVFVSPFTTEVASGGDLASRVTVGGLPLSVAMMFFRIIRIILYWIVFEVTFRVRVYSGRSGGVVIFILIGLSLLSIAKIMNVLGYVDMSMYSTYTIHDRGHIIGHSKAASTRLFMVGCFLSLILVRQGARWMWLGVIAALIMVVGIYFSGARAAALGLVVGLSVTMVTSRTSGFIMLVTMVPLISYGVFKVVTLNPDHLYQYILLLEEPGSDGRWTIWSWVVNVLIEQPGIMVTGVGFSNFGYALLSEGGVAEHAHNDILNVLVEMGVMGFVVFVLYVVEMCRFVGHNAVASLPRWTSSCLLGMGVSLLVTLVFEPTFYYSPSLVSMHRIMVVVVVVILSMSIQRQKRGGAAQIQMKKMVI